MPKVLEYNATMVERIDLSPALAIFRIKPDDGIPEGRWFVPGQYMVLGLNNEGVPELGSVRRPMSIASEPQQRDTIDFYIRFVSKPESKNPLTHLLWKLKNGDRMYVRAKPTGHFTVDHTVGAEDPRLRILVAAGTGLAPFTSMVYTELAANPEARLDNWAILHGASYPNEIGYKEQLEGLVEKHGLKYLPTISRPKEAPEWSEHTGRVEDFFRAERLADTEKHLGLEAGGLTPENCTIFICGLQGTIGMTIERTLSRGFIPDNRKLRKALDIEEDAKAALFFEQYDSTPVLDIKNPDEVTRLKALLASAD